MVKSSIDKREKAAQLTRILNSSKVGVAELREFALSPYGYISDELRRKVWPKLLGVHAGTKPPAYDKEKLIAHRDYTQVVLDVDRSLRRFPPAMKEEHRQKLQEQLTTLIMRVLVNNPELHYYQGYHDICVTFLLILGKDLSFLVVDAVSRSHLRDFMDADMHRTRSMLNYLYPILKRADNQVKEYMEKAEVGTIFCLSWLITWYGHVLDDSKHTVRLYDLFLASHPLMPIYLAAAVVIHRREEILRTECEMCFIHVLLSDVPGYLPFEELIASAQTLLYLYPPPELAAEAEFEYERSKTMKNFAKFEKGVGLKRENVYSPADGDKLIAKSSQEQSVLFKVTMWSLTAAVGAAFIAAQYVASSYG